MGTAGTTIRTATIDDLDAIVDLHTRARTAYYQAGGVPEDELAGSAKLLARRTGWERAVTAPDMTVLCAVRNRTVVGVVSLGPPRDADLDPRTVGRLYQIHVQPGCWRQGIGGRLHAAYVRRLRAASLPVGAVEVWERNDRARAFYARHGWRPDGQHRPGPLQSPYLRLRLHVPSTAPGCDQH